MADNPEISRTPGATHRRHTRPTSRIPCGAGRQCAYFGRLWPAELLRVTDTEAVTAASYRPLYGLCRHGQQRQSRHKCRLSRRALGREHLPETMAVPRSETLFRTTTRPHVPTPDVNMRLVSTAFSVRRCSVRMKRQVPRSLRSASAPMSLHKFYDKIWVSRSCR